MPYGTRLASRLATTTGTILFSSICIASAQLLAPADGASYNSGASANAVPCNAPEDQSPASSGECPRRAAMPTTSGLEQRSTSSDWRTVSGQRREQRGRDAVPRPE